MRISELQEKLDEEGCAPLNYAIASRGSDAYCLMNDGMQWRVLCSERGWDADPVFTTASESEACEFFLDLMRKQPNWHLFGVFPSELEAKAFEREIERRGATTIRNDLPESILGTPQFGIFVAGRDIHLVRDLKPRLILTKRPTSPQPTPRSSPS